MTSKARISSPDPSVLPVRTAEVRESPELLHEATAEDENATGWLQETKTFVYDERFTGHTVTGPIA